MGIAETVLSELDAARPPAAPARFQAIDKISYTHEDMIDFIIANPQVSQGKLAARYGYTQAWICQVMQSDAWQSLAAKRRSELVDPVLLHTLNERFQALTVRSLERLMEKLDAPVVSDNVVLKAVELGAKAMGVGGNAAPAAPAADHLAELAKRLIALNPNTQKGELYEGTAVEVLAAPG